MKTTVFILLILAYFYRCTNADRNIYFTINPNSTNYNFTCYYLEGENANIVIDFSDFYINYAWLNKILINQTNIDHSHKRISIPLTTGKENTTNKWILKLYTNKNQFNLTNDKIIFELYNGFYYRSSISNVQLKVLKFPTVTINDTSLDLTVVEDHDPYRINIKSEYEHRPGDILKIVCEYKSDNLSQSHWEYCNNISSCSKRKKSEQTESKQKHTITRSVDNRSRISCIYEESKVIITVTVKFSEKKLKELQMTVNGESHQNNFTYNYMEDDDNTVNVTCVLAKSPESMMTYDIQMIEGFGNFSTINSSISTLNRNFKLGINHNGTNIRCILIDHDNKEEIATIFMTLNITTPNKNKGQLWLWILIICACVILIFITLSIIKAIKKYFRTLRQSNTEYENLTSQNTQPFPNSSTLEATYCSPADLKSSGSENIYAQPYKPKNPEDLYSIPIPKSKRKNPPAESLYAELAFHNKNDQIDSRNLGRNEKEPEYACIKKAPNANDKQKQASSTDYTNVFEKDRYVNSKDQEYVEPSYYEVGHR